MVLFIFMRFHINIPGLGTLNFCNSLSFKECIFSVSTGKAPVYENYKMLFHNYVLPVMLFPAGVGIDASGDGCDKAGGIGFCAAEIADKDC